MVLSHPKPNSWGLALGASVIAIASVIGSLAVSTMTTLPKVENHPVQVSRMPLQPFFPDLELVEQQVEIALLRREAMRTKEISQFIEINAAQGDTGEDIQVAYMQQLLQQSKTINP